MLETRSSRDPTAASLRSAVRGFQLFFMKAILMYEVINKHVSHNFSSGVEGAFDGEGCKTVIPKKVTGKFSIRIVPHQTPDAIEHLVRHYCHKVHEESGSPNVLK